MPSSAVFLKMAPHLWFWVTSTSSQRSYNHLNSSTFLPHLVWRSLLLPPPTVGNQLDLVFTRSCTTSALCYPLPLSDNHFVTFFLTLNSPTSLPTTLHIVTSCRNLKNSLSLYSLRNCPLLTTTPRTILPPVRRGSLLHSDILSPPPWTHSAHSPPDQHDPLLPLRGCPKLCRLVEQSCGQLRENGGNQTLLMITTSHHHRGWESVGISGGPAS